MATLGLGIIISIVLTTEAGVTGGPDGMTVPPLALFGWAVKGEHAWYWVAGAGLLVRGLAGAEPDRVAAPVARCARCTAPRSPPRRWASTARAPS